MYKAKIEVFPFSFLGKDTIQNKHKYKDWPVVYLIHNDKELYIGETQNIAQRLDDHLSNPSRRNLKEVDVVFDEEFNKSAILDIEQNLIQLFGASQEFELQNRNGGQSEKHNYYQRAKYLKKVDDIWKELFKIGLTKKDINELRNTDLFKYSPYNTLTVEQSIVTRNIIYDMMDCFNNKIDGTAIISGGAGTGKTIVLISIIYKLINAQQIEIDYSDLDANDYNQLIHDIKIFLDKNKDFKIGYVVPMSSMRKTIKTVFKETKNGLKASIVIGPFDVFKNDYDLLIVDEAHRLSQYKNIGYRGTYKKHAESLGKNPEDITELDMLVAKSKFRILVYDENQTVKGSDITKTQFKKALINSKVSKYNLTTQMRCAGGELYTDYISNIFDCTQKDKEKIDNYDFKLFDDGNEMIDLIKKMDKEYGLCRNAAGYSWEWKSKDEKNYDDVIKKGLEDIEIDGKKYVWNMTNEEFILSKNAVNEIGCIHTMQGYDLNYAGIIVGKEIDYDPIKNEIVIDVNNFYDKYVKQGSDYKTLKKYIINSYKVILSRGIKGTYVYVCNKNMKMYLERFIDKYR